MNDSRPEVPLIVVMGVSGCGKSTVGALIADRLAIPFVDSDSLHPRTNIEKMAAGVPLTDGDRWPWLAKVGQVLALGGRDGTGVVVACSALRRSYRDAIRAEAPDAVFVHLSGNRNVLVSRLEGRSGHFMPTTLLDSQFATLEPLQADEPGIVVDIGSEVPVVIDAAVVEIRSLYAL